MTQPYIMLNVKRKQCILILVHMHNLFQTEVKFCWHCTVPFKIEKYGNTILHSSKRYLFLSILKVTTTGNTKTRKVLLFNDLLLVARNESNGFVCQNILYFQNFPNTAFYKVLNYPIF